MSERKENPVLLLRRILEISEKEQKEIDENNLDKLDHYCSLKNDLMCKLKELDKSESWISSPDKSSEIESILKKIDEINNANAEAVREKRDKVMGQICDQQTTKTAINAYNKLA